MTAPNLKNRVGMSVSGTPAAGDVSLGSALAASATINAPAWRTFAAASVANGDIVRCLFLDTGGWEVSNCTYSTTGPTLTSRTLIESSTGSLLSLTSAAQVFIAAVAQDMLAPDGAAVTDNAIVRYDGTTGNKAQGSGVLIDDNGLIDIPSGNTNAGFRTTSQNGSEQYLLYAESGTLKLYDYTFGGVRMEIFTGGTGSIGWVCGSGGNFTVTGGAIFTKEEGSGNSVVSPFYIGRTTSGTPAIGIGVSMEMQAEVTAGLLTGATLEAQSTNITAPNVAFVMNGRQMVSSALQDAFGVSFIFRSLSANAGYINTNGTVQPWFPGAGVITVEATTTYEFEGILYIGTTGATTAHTIALSFVLGGSSSLNSIAYTAEAHHAIANTTISAATANLVNFTTVLVNTAVIVTAASGVTNALITAIHVRGVMRVNAGGTVTPSWNMGTAARGAGSVLANTFFKMRKVGINTNTIQGSVT